MPVHNAGPFLPSAVFSILDQLDAADEMVVVDDGSTDDSYEWLLETARQSPQITVLRNDRPQGISKAFNKAILHGTCPYFVAIAEHDDVSLPRRLSEQRRFLVAHPDYGAVSSEGKYVGPNGRIFGRVSVGPKTEDDFEALKADGEALLIPHPAVTYRRDALVEAGLYDPVFDGAQDIDLINRLVFSAGWKIRTLDASHFLYRLHPAATTFNQFREQRMIARFVRYRNCCALAGETSLPYGSWRTMGDSAPPRIRFRRWRHDRGALHYRKSGLAWLTKRRARAIWNILAAVLWHPRWVVMKLAILFGWTSPGSVDTEAHLRLKREPRSRE